MVGGGCPVFSSLCSVSRILDHPPRGEETLSFKLSSLDDWSPFTFYIAIFFFSLQVCKMVGVRCRLNGFLWQPRSAGFCGKFDKKDSFVDRKGSSQFLFKGSFQLSCHQEHPIKSRRHGNNPHEILYFLIGLRSTKKQNQFVKSFTYMSRSPLNDVDPDIRRWPHLLDRVMLNSA